MLHLNLNPHHHHNPSAILTMLVSLAVGLQAAEVLRKRGSRYSYWIFFGICITLMTIISIVMRIRHGYWF